MIGFHIEDKVDFWAGALIGSNKDNFTDVWCVS